MNELTKISRELTQKLTSLMVEYSAKLPLAVAVGTLEIIKSAILHASLEDAMDKNNDKPWEQE